MTMMKWNVRLPSLLGLMFGCVADNNASVIGNLTVGARKSHAKIFGKGSVNQLVISRRQVRIFIIKGFRTIVFIFIVISTTFRPICPPAFFRCLSNSEIFTELRTTSFIESTGVICSNSVNHNRVQVLNIPVLLLACSQDWTCKLQMIVSLEA